MDDVWVDDLRVIPQPGNFYGGWVTPDLEGRIKGAPGTQHWQTTACDARGAFRRRAGPYLAG